MVILDAKLGVTVDLAVCVVSVDIIGPWPRPDANSGVLKCSAAQEDPNGALVIQIETS